MWFDDTGDFHGDVLRAMTRVNQILEGWIRSVRITGFGCTNAGLSPIESRTAMRLFPSLRKINNTRKMILFMYFR